LDSARQRPRLDRPAARRPQAAHSLRQTTSELFAGEVVATFASRMLSAADRAGFCRAAALEHVALAAANRPTSAVHRALACKTRNQPDADCQDRQGCSPTAPVPDRCPGSPAKAV